MGVLTKLCVLRNFAVKTGGFTFDVHSNPNIKSMSNLQNKTVVVIGGSSGIGLAVASLAHELGAAVYVTSRNLQKATDAAVKVGTHVRAAALDVNDEQSIQSFFSGLPEEIDHVYIAAGSTRLGSLTDGNLEEAMQAFDERLRGSLRVVRASVHKIKAQGSITFTGGISTDRPISGAWVSGLGTASAEQLARVLVMEFPHIRFNAVSPGYTDTPMWDAIMGGNKAGAFAGIAEKLPVKKIATPQEVASAVIFLMTNASVTGEVIHVDGGARLV